MMRFWPLILIGCAKDDGVTSLIDGRISLPEYGESAEVSWDKAFYAVSNGTMLAFVTGVEGASCARISEFLSTNDGPTEKQGIYHGGGCVMTVKINDWSGSYQAAWDPSETDWNPAVDSSIRCEFGSGSWELGVNSSGREDYYWTGSTWAGHPTVFDWSFEEDGNAIDLAMDMSAYDGSLLYESTGEVEGSGDLSGSVRATACGAMKDATVL
mgnify:CR=1 FL=1